METNRNNSILIRVLAITVAGFLLLALAFHYIFNSQLDNELKVHVSDNYMMLSEELESSIEIRTSWMKTSLLLLQHSSSSPALVSALQNRSRERLLELSLDYFTDLKVNNSITHMYFLDQNRRVVLRMHQPDRYDDIINRVSARKAQEEASFASGIELGALGTLTLRVVVPWIHDGISVGFIELGMELDKILKSINSDSPFQIILTINKSLIRMDDWTVGQKMMGRDNHWSQFEHQVLAFPPTGFGKDVSLLHAYLEKSDDQVYMLEIDGKCHGFIKRPFLA